MREGEKGLSLGISNVLVLYHLSSSNIVIQSSAEDTIPNFYAEMLYKQKTDGKLSESVHGISFGCPCGDCSMTTPTLNQ